MQWMSASPWRDVDSMLQEGQCSSEHPVQLQCVLVTLHSFVHVGVSVGSMCVGSGRGVEVRGCETQTQCSILG